jgi:hypothetical protein
MSRLFWVVNFWTKSSSNLGRRKRPTWDASYSFAWEEVTCILWYQHATDPWPTWTITQPHFIPLKRGLLLFYLVLLGLVNGHFPSCLATKTRTYLVSVIRATCFVPLVLLLDLASLMSGQVHESWCSIMRAVLAVFQCVLTSTYPPMPQCLPSAQSSAVVRRELCE